MATVQRAVEKHGVRDILLIARTSRDIRSTLVPALLSFYKADHPNKPHFSSGTAEIIWPNGAKATTVSAESGSDSVRGLNNELIVADEMAFYGGSEEIVDMALLTLRREPSKFIGLTSPKATPMMVDIVSRFKDGEEGLKVVTGSTYNNQENLSKAFMSTVVNRYENTSYARSELHGELVLENPSALFQMATIERNLVKPNMLPEMEEIVIGVDPSTMSKKSNVGQKKGRTPDLCGIVVAGKGSDGQFYVLDNLSGSFSVQGWVSKTAELYDYYREFCPTSLVVEINTMSEELLRDLYRQNEREDVFRATKSTFSTQSKLSRLQPFALIAEQDKIKWADKPSLSKLFTELCSYDGTGRSPDMADAFAFAMSGVSPVRKSFTRSYELLI